MSTSFQHTTILLARAADGDRAAVDELMPRVYDALRRLAADFLRHERVGHSLVPTALAHEALVRLLGPGPVQVHSRAHFFALAARCMRRILVNHARDRHAIKRGGKRAAVGLGRAAGIALDEVPDVAAASAVDLLALDEALSTLSELDPRKAQIVEHRFFGGMTTQETAEVLGVSVSTVESDWRTARAWLSNQLES